jgi:hypothetical protein
MPHTASIMCLWQRWRDCHPVIVLLLAMPRDLNIVDEGIILTDAIRVLQGEVIHRDFLF